VVGTTVETGTEGNWDVCAESGVSFTARKFLGCILDCRELSVPWPTTAARPIGFFAAAFFDFTITKAAIKPPINAAKPTKPTTRPTINPVLLAFDPLLPPTDGRDELVVVVVVAVVVVDWNKRRWKDIRELLEYYFDFYESIKQD
jgi:hypothetical protein